MVYVAECLRQRLRELDIQIYENSTPGQPKDYSSIKDGDVVIFPAFGATVQEMQLFKDKGVQVRGRQGLHTAVGASRGAAAGGQQQSCSTCTAAPDCIRLIGCMHT